MSGLAKDTNPKDAAATSQGRVPMSLFPSSAIVAGAMAFHEGACKYGRYNWRIAGVRVSVYMDAIARHLTAYWNGEHTDPDSGLPHTWKALACIAILIDAEQCGKLVDDRPPSAPIGELLADLKPLVRDIEERLRDYHPYQPTIADRRFPEGDETARVASAFSGITTRDFGSGS